MDHNNLIAIGYKISGGGIPVTNNDDGVSKMETIISNFIGLLTFVAVIYFVIRIILAGYSFISSQGDEKKMIEARSSLTNSVLGLVIVVVALGLGSLIAHLLGMDGLFDFTTTITSLVLPN